VTVERYARLFDLVAEGAATLENKGDKTAARDSGTIISDLMGSLPISEMLNMATAMIGLHPAGRIAKEEFIASRKTSEGETEKERA
jgi:hypothetical protein